MTKTIADLLLSLHGFILMSGGMVMERMAEYAKLTDQSLKVLK
jgi:hypothetical protein